jgi:hypothetical protein
MKIVRKSVFLGCLFLLFLSNEIVAMQGGRGLLPPRISRSSWSHDARSDDRRILICRHCGGHNDVESSSFVHIPPYEPAAEGFYEPVEELGLLPEDPPAEEPHFDESEQSHWSCSVCTFSNDISSESCQMCGALHSVHGPVEGLVSLPEDPPAAGLPADESEQKIAWECQSCTFLNENLFASECEVCGSQRPPAFQTVLRPV